MTTPLATTPVFGYQGQLGIDSANPVTKRYDFRSETLALHEELFDATGMRGTRAHSIERIRQNVRKAQGQIHLQPTTFELAQGILQWALGGTPSGGPTVTYPLAETLPQWFVTVDRGAKVYTYNGCVVSKMTIRGSQAQPLDIMLDVLGLDETQANAGTFPAGLALDATTKPFLFMDLFLTVNAVQYYCRDLEIVIDNLADGNRFMNAQTLTAVFSTDRKISVNATMPFGDATAIYALADSGTTGSASFQYGGANLTMTFGKLVWPRRSPTVPNREEIFFPIAAQAVKVGSTPEVTTTMNPGP